MVLADFRFQRLSGRLGRGQTAAREVPARKEVNSMKKQRTSIEELSVSGHELSDEDLRLAAGGLVIRFASYQAASSTLGNDTDYRRVD